MVFGNGVRRLMRLALGAATGSLGGGLAFAASVVKIEGKTFTLPDGLTIEKVGASPQVERPIAADFDEQGRLYVAESSGSSENVQKQLKERPHRVVRLEDADGDGRYEKQVIFADRMMFPEGAMWHDGSLYVAAPPSIWKLTDSDGNGVADDRVEWFEGKTLTGCANDLHGPYMGLDGWIYWNKGAFAEQTYHRPGKKPLVTKAAHIFRARAGGAMAMEIEPVMTGGMDNPIDTVMLPSGERFFTTTFLQHPAGGKRDGILHAVYGGVYGKTHSVIDNHPRTGPEMMPVMVHLGPAAPAGLHRYESRTLGEEYQDNLFAALFNMRKLTRHVLTPRGGTYQSRDEDFLLCDSLDFHPTDVIEDADGSLLIIDTGGWYKLCCPTSQLEKPDVLGAIYRVKRIDHKPVDDPWGRRVQWGALQADQLAALLDDDRPAVRRRAMQMLAKRKAKATAALTRRLADGSPLARLNVVWTAARIHEPEAGQVIRAALADPQERVRHAAVHAASVRRDRDAVARLLTLLQDDTPSVKRAVAEALGRIGDGRAVPHLLSALERDDAEERVLEHSLTFALMELGSMQEIKAALSSKTPRVQRSAMVALDQMEGGGLEAHVVAVALTSTEAATRRCAAWIAGRHPQWGDALAGVLREQLARAAEKVDERARLREQLANLAKSPAIEKLLADALIDANGSLEARLLCIEAMRDAGIGEVPAVWLAAMDRVLQERETRLIHAVVAALRAMRIAQPQAAKAFSTLLAVLQREDLAADVRVSAAAALPKGFNGVSDAIFSFLTTQLLSHPALPVKLAAAESISRIKLSPRQIRALGGVLKEAGPMELDRVLAAAEQSTDAAVGMELLAALREARNLRVLAPESVRRAFTKYPEQVRQHGERLIAEISPQAGEQKAKLDRIAAELPAGDIRRGQLLFNSERAACATCHAIGYLGGNVGPDLTTIGAVRQERDLLESIVLPSASFVQSYQPVIIDTADNHREAGILKKDDAQEIVLVTGPNAEIRIPRSNVKLIKPSPLSVMPEGFSENFTRQELADLLAFLKACR